MGAIRDKVNAALKAAMAARDKTKIPPLRFILAEFKNVEVDMRRSLTDFEEMSAVMRLIKQRKDSIVQYQAGGRQDLADAEQEEAEVMESFLPRTATDEETRMFLLAAIQAQAAETGRSPGMADLGTLLLRVQENIAANNLRPERQTVFRMLRTELSGK